MHHILLPLKGQIVPMENGHQRIVLTINGRVSMMLDYDPASATLEDVPLEHDPHDFTEHRDPRDRMERKGPMGDHD